MKQTINCVLTFDDEGLFTKTNKIPQLSQKQKNDIKELMTIYFNNKNLFVYDGDTRRESYAYPKVRKSGIEGCLNSTGKYYLNCGVFAQMIWMGRSIEDFIEEYPTVEINTFFDWGYYFDFLAAQTSYGVMKSGTKYYNSNTYLNNGIRKFITYDNAAAMAMELYYKGYEIPYSQVDIGDLVFYRTESEIDGDTDNLEQTSFRNITHVALVYDIDVDGIPLIIECSSAYKAAIGKASLSPEFGVSTFGLVRGSHLTSRVCMAARHPAAWNVKSNIPLYFETYRHK